MFNKAASSIEVEHTQVRRGGITCSTRYLRWDHMFNKAASSIEVEHTQVRRLVGSHVQQGSQQYRGRTHSGT